MHTNETAHYNLPQFLASDKATWLNDVNSAFFEIDTQMFKNSQTADSAVTSADNAKAKADSVQTNVEALTKIIDTITADVGSAGTSIETLTTQMNTVNSSTQSTNKSLTDFYTGYSPTVESEPIPKTFATCGQSIGIRLQALEDGSGNAQVEQRLSALENNLQETNMTVAGIGTRATSNTKAQTDFFNGYKDSVGSGQSVPSSFSQVGSTIGERFESLELIQTYSVATAVTIPGISGVTPTSGNADLNIIGKMGIVSASSFNYATNATGAAQFSFNFPSEISGYIDKSYIPKTSSNANTILSGKVSGTWVNDTLTFTLPEENPKSTHGVLLGSFVIKML